MHQTAYGCVATEQRLAQIALRNERNLKE